jgi:predicted RNase H-like nuclease (RuvC/YqgF family)
MKKDIIKKVAGVAVDAAIQHAPDIAKLGIDMVKKAKGIQDPPASPLPDPNEKEIAELYDITLYLKKKMQELETENLQLRDELTEEKNTLSAFSKKISTLKALSFFGIAGTVISIIALVLVIIK